MSDATPCSATSTTLRLNIAVCSVLNRSRSGIGLSGSDECVELEGVKVDAVIESLKRIVCKVSGRPMKF